MKKFDKKDIEDILALTPMQEGMLFHYIKDPQNHQYLGQLSLGLSGEIDIQCFEKAWNFVIETNEMLRTLFNWEKVKKPVQIVLKEYHLKIKYVDFSDMETKEREKLFEETKNRDRKEKFDLRDIAFRVTLCKLGIERYEMIISNHHILYDGWSSGIILNEFFDVYKNLVINRIPVKPVKNPFKIYMEWLREQDSKDCEGYWKVYLSGFDEKTGMPYKIKNNKGKIDGGNYRKLFANELKGRLEEFAKKNRVTMAVIFYLAWGLLLQKYNNCEDVVFGTTVSGRPAKIKGIQEMVGLFINTLPLRLNTKSNEKIIESLNKIAKHLKDREKYESASLVEIKKGSELDNREELFDSIVIVENYPLDKRIADDKNGLSISSYTMTETTNYPLTVGITVSETIEVNISYDNNFFDPFSVFKIFYGFCAIINDIVHYPGKEISFIEIILKEEKEQILYEFNNTAVDYPEEKTIHQLFEEQVQKTPDGVAIVGSGQLAVGKGMALSANKREKIGEKMQLTYGELNKKSDQLAYVLKEKGAKSDAIVGIMTEPSVQMVVGIFGILKSGGAYLPIDPDYPEERIKYMLADATVDVLVTTENLFKEGEKKEIIYLDSYKKSGPIGASSETLHAPCSMLHASNTGSSSLAYIIYTSGTTGRPKGVLVDHRNAVNTLLCRKEEYKMAPDDCSLQLFSYTFDGFVTSFFTPVISGSRVLLLDKKGRKDISRIKEAIVFGGVTHFISVPALFQALIDTLGPGEAASLKVVTLAGDRLPLSLLESVHAREGNVEISHEYGVTEVAVMSTICRNQQKKKEITIGKPVWNTGIYILNKHMQLQPKGAVGELCIAGKGAARGYLNRPQLTTEKFDRDFQDYQDYQDEKGSAARKPYIEKEKGIDKNPLTSLPLYPSTPLYRTGDLARWLPDGNIEFLGRIDHQVKIRGFRIESEEIESRLSEHPGVKEAVVLAREKESGEKYLCAYIVARNRNMAQEAWSAGELREHLSQTLPRYMIPSHFVAVEKIPLSANGKIERKALPKPEVEQGDTYAGPRDHPEKKMVEIWAEVLEVEPANIGIDDDFFNLGGHSLKATPLISKIHKEMNVKIPIDALFETPTIRALAAYVKEEAKQDRYVSIPKAEKREYYPLSAAQKRLYITQHMKLESVAYNVQNAVWLEGTLSREMLEGAFRKLIERHESFRTSFEMIDDEPVQRIYDKVGFEIEYYELTAKIREDTRRIDESDYSSNPFIEQMHHFVHPFDLSQAPLLRVGLIEAGEGKYILMTDMHHIIVDFFSMNLFIKDFTAFCRKEELPPLNLQYKDFSHWQSITGRKEQDEVLNRQETYWLETLGGQLPALNLPFDYPRPAIQQFGGAVVPFELDRETTALLKKMALEEEVTLFMMLLAVFNVLLARVCDQEDILVGTPVAGRRHADLQPVIGLFVNMLVLRNQPNPQKPFQVFLKEVKVKTLKAYENQDYPYETLVDTLSVERDGSRSAMFDAAFVWEGPDIELGYIPPIVTGEGTEGLKLKPYKWEKSSAVFDIILTGSESRENIHFSIIYKTSLFKRKTIESISSDFKEVLRSIVTDRNINLEDISISHGLMAAKSHALIEDRGDFGF